MAEAKGVNAAAVVAATARQQQQPFHVKYPVNTKYKLSIKGPSENNNDEKEEVIYGRIYCTDETSRIVVLELLNNNGVKLINEECINYEKSEKLPEEYEVNNNNNGSSNNNNTVFPQPCPLGKKKITKQSIDEKEKRSKKLAEEAFRQINENASTLGQEVFDKLVKACNVVVWKGVSIVVLNEIQVDSPYGVDNCSILKSAQKNSSHAESSLERVKRVVGSTSLSLSSPSQPSS